MNNSSSPVNTTTSSSADSSASPQQKGKCKALYDFQALNPGELDFKGLFFL
jgi:hypothetical protein